MQLDWLFRGLRIGVLTTRYPRVAEAMPVGWRGVVVLDPARCAVEGMGAPCIESCLPGALSVARTVDAGGHLALDPLACIACGLCLDACPAGALSMTPQFELARRTHAGPRP